MVRDRVAQDVESLVDNTKASMDFLGEAFLDSPLAHLITRQLGLGAATLKRIVEEDEVLLGYIVDWFVKQVMEFTDKYFLADGNIESQSADSTTFLLNGAVTCPGLCALAAKYNAKCDDTCDALLNRAQWRLEITGYEAAGGTMKVTQTIGADRQVVATGSLSPTMTQSTVEAELIVGIVLFFMGPDTPMPQEAAGQIEASYAADGKAGVTAKVSVTEAFDVEDSSVTVKLGQTDSLATFMLDPETKQARAGVNLMGLEISVTPPPGAPPTAGFALDLPAFTAQVVQDVSAVPETMSIDNFGFGDRAGSLSIGGMSYVFDFNAEYGRVMNAQMTVHDPDASATFIADPAFVYEGVSTHDGAATANTVSFTSDNAEHPQMTVTPLPGILTPDLVANVINGALLFHLESTGVGPVTAEAGMCMSLTGNPRPYDCSSP